MYIFTKSNHLIITRKFIERVRSSVPKTSTLRNTGSYYTQGDVFFKLLCPQLYYYIHN